MSATVVPLPFLDPNKDIPKLVWHRLAWRTHLGRAMMAGWKAFADIC